MSIPEEDPGLISAMEEKAADIEAKVRTLAAQAKADIEATAAKLVRDLEQALSS